MGLNAIKIQSLLEASDLGIDEQNEFLRFLAAAHDEELSELATLFEEDPSWVRKLYENYQHKRSFWRKEASQSWRSLVEDEADTLEESEKQ
ncbi:MAG: hypothetical protein Q8L52_00430 [bacterium]|nr:hypothetical protein [bacterium]